MTLMDNIRNILKKNDIGKTGEDAAADYVKVKGMRILHRNWRHGRLELDMICEDGETIVFVEVKTRKVHGITSPVEGISKHKRATLLRAAKTWLTTHNAWHRPCRFDVIGILYDAKDANLKLRVEYYDNAFDLNAAMGGGNASWQPW